MCRELVAIIHRVAHTWGHDLDLPEHRRSWLMVVIAVFTVLIGAIVQAPQALLATKQMLETPPTPPPQAMREPPQRPLAHTDPDANLPIEERHRPASPPIVTPSGPGGKSNKVRDRENVKPRFTRLKQRLLNHLRARHPGLVAVAGATRRCIDGAVACVDLQLRRSHGSGILVPVDLRHASTADQFEEIVDEAERHGRQCLARSYISGDWAMGCRLISECVRSHRNSLVIAFALTQSALVTTDGGSACLLLSP